MSPKPRAVYADLDGTLLGPGGSLFTSPDGYTLKAVQAVFDLHEADVKLVLISGRTQAQMSELARALSASAYIAELGSLIVRRVDGAEQITRQFGEWRGVSTPYESAVSGGAGTFLLESYPGALEPHTPWSSHHREATMLFRGQIDAASANEALASAGHAWLKLTDNGIIRRTFPGLEVAEVHAYHLAPRGVSKTAGVARHMRLEGIDGADAAAVGDSLSDLEIASVVSEVFIVENGREAVGHAIREHPNAAFTESSHGTGFAEAVAELLSR